MMPSPGTGKRQDTLSHNLWHVTVFLPLLHAFIDSHTPGISAFLLWLEASLILVPQVPTSAHPCSCTYSVCTNGTACTSNVRGIRPTSVSVQKSRNTSGILTISTLSSSLAASWQEIDTAETLQVSELPPKERAWEKKSAFRQQILCWPCKQNKELISFSFIPTCLASNTHGQVQILMKVQTLLHTGWVLLPVHVYVPWVQMQFNFISLESTVCLNIKKTTDIRQKHHSP